MNRDQIDQHLRTLSRYIDRSYDASAGYFDARNAVIELRKALLADQPAATETAPTCCQGTDCGRCVGCIRKAETAPASASKP